MACNCGVLVVKYCVEKFQEVKRETVFEELDDLKAKNVLKNTDKCVSLGRNDFFVSF